MIPIFRVFSSGNSLDIINCYLRANRALHRSPGAGPCRMPIYQHVADPAAPHHPRAPTQGRESLLPRAKPTGRPQGPTPPRLTTFAPTQGRAPLLPAIMGKSFVRLSHFVGF